MGPCIPKWVPGIVEAHLYHFLFYPLNLRFNCFPEMIRPAKIAEIPDIMTITRACAAEMESRGIFQWNAHYPTEAAFRVDVKRGELFLLEEGGVILGCIVISTLQDPEYKAVSWLSRGGPNLYIHRLAIHPDHQGKGYARRLMDFAEDRARQFHAISVRLDTFSRNPRNQRFYERRGYHKLGDIHFPLQSPHPFHCYELLL